ASQIDSRNTAARRPLVQRARSGRGHSIQCRADSPGGGMNWETLYLLCFLVGFLLSAVSFLSGMVHLPHLHVHGHAHGGAGGRGGGRSGLSPFNFGTIAAFLAWFG